MIVPTNKHKLLWTHSRSQHSFKPSRKLNLQSLWAIWEGPSMLRPVNYISDDVSLWAPTAPHAPTPLKLATETHMRISRLVCTSAWRTQHTNFIMRSTYEKINVFTSITHYLLLNTRRSVVREIGFIRTKVKWWHVSFWLKSVGMMNLVIDWHNSFLFLYPYLFLLLLACLSVLCSRETSLSAPLKTRLPCNIYSVLLCLITQSKLCIPKPQTSCLGFLSTSGTKTSSKQSLRMTFKQYLSTFVNYVSCKTEGLPRWRSNKFPLSNNKYLQTTLDSTIYALLTYYLPEFVWSCCFRISQWPNYDCKARLPRYHINKYFTN